MQNTKFENPYRNVPKEQLTRLTTKVDLRDYELVKVVRCKSATLATTQNILWQKLCTWMRTNGVTDASRLTEFEQFVANCVLVDPRNLTTSAIVACGGAKGPGHTGHTDGLASRPIAGQQVTGRVQRGGTTRVSRGKQQSTHGTTDTQGQNVQSGQGHGGD